MSSVINNQYIIFLEVENFLTDEECQLIVDLANASGLTQSTTVRTKKGTRLPRQKILELFHGKDVNSDGLLDRYEVRKTVVIFRQQRHEEVSEGK